MLRPALFALCLAATPVMATQEYILPTLFDVTGVAAGDVLNIRAEPNGSAEIIGTFAPDATGIEVIDVRGNWGRVNTHEQSGWVSMRFLNYRTDVWEPGRLPANFICHGTEPFWSLRAEGDDMIWDTPDGATRFGAATIMDDGLFRSPRRALLAEEDHDLLAMTVTPKQCSDGMSDRVYGLEATLILNGRAARDGGTQMFTGCCLVGGNPTD